MSDAEEETGEDAESDVEPEADASEEETGEAEADGEAAAETEEVETVETAYGCTVTYSFGQRVIHVPVDAWHATAAALFTDGWEMCVDLTSVDYSAYETARRLPVGVEPERYEVVASFISHSRRERIRARAQVPETNPAIDSIYDIYPGVDYLEREVYDLMGITFDGHPDLSRILMPETWEGHPLRKDFAIGSIPVQFKAGSGTGVEPS